MNGRRIANWRCLGVREASRIAAVYTALGCASSPARDRAAGPNTDTTVQAPASNVEQPHGEPRPKAVPRVIDVAAAWTEVCDGDWSFELEVAGSRHYVQVELPGTTEQLRFHVDTGGNTPGLAIQETVARGLGFESAAAMPRTVRIGGVTLQLPHQTHWVFLDERATNDGWMRRKNYSVGQLGAGFLSRYLVCVDPERNRLGLANPANMRISTSTPPSVDLMMVSGGPNHALYPFTHVMLAQEGTFTGGYGVLVDTGASTSMLDERKVARQSVSGRSFGRGTAGDADMVGGAWLETWVRVSEAVLNTPRAFARSVGREHRGGASIGPVTFVGRPDGSFSRLFGDVPWTMGSHGAIGNDVWNRFRILIDYAEQRMWLVPTNRPKDASASDTRVGVSIAFRPDGCPTVTQVSKGKDAHVKQLVRTGDVLLEVNGRNACALWHHELSAALSGKAGDKIALKLTRSGRTMVVDATVSTLR